MLRRLKHKVEKRIPPRLETRVFCSLSPTQAGITKNLLLQDTNLIIRAEEAVGGGARPGTSVYKELHNLVMQLRKVVNQPYLLRGAKGDLESTGLATLVAL